jgi:RNA polymerase sigma factor (TIGR02999 family)
VAEPDTHDVTRLLTAIGSGDRHAADELLPVVYDKLRRLAQKQLAREPPGLTLQATALVHEAFLRLVGDNPTESVWDNRGHFYAAAAQAMRRILVERARRQRRLKHGGGRQRVPFDDVEADTELTLEPDELLRLDQAMSRLSDQDRQMHDIAMLRYFGGLTVGRIAEVLGVSTSTVDREWRCARLWLYDQMTGGAS